IVSCVFYTRKALVRPERTRLLILRAGLFVGLAMGLGLAAKAVLPVAQALVHVLSGRAGNNPGCRAHYKNTASALKRNQALRHHELRHVVFAFGVAGAAASLYHAHACARLDQALRDVGTLIAGVQ